MKFKKIISVVTLLAVAGSMLTGCDSGTTSSGTGSTGDNNSSTTESKVEESKTESKTEDSGTTEKKDVSLKVWGSKESQELLKEMCDAFAAANPDTNWTFEYGMVSEADAKTEVLKDPTAAADVFNFASDQTGELVSAGALYKVTKNKDQIVADNSQLSIESATVNGELYAYPLVSDTYFLYYDKSKVTEKDVQSLETIMSVSPAGFTTNFAFDIDNGWYLASFFFGAGCQLFGADGNDPTICDFNNAQGKMVGEYLIDLAANTKFGNFDDALVKSGFAEGTLATAVSGAWNAEDIKASLGDNYAATKLPTFTLSDGKSYQMGSMANFKLVGVNSSTKNPLEAMALAEWLSNYDNQFKNFEQRSFSPTNKKLAEDADKMSSNPAVAAVANQLQYATRQTNIPQMGKYWTPAEAFGAGIYAKEITKDNVQEKLDQFVESVLATLG